MKNLLISLLTLFSFLFLLCFIKTKSVEASTEVYKITDAFHVAPPPTFGTNYVEYYKYISFNYRGGDVIVSRNPDGTGAMDIGDILQVAALNNAFNYLYPPHTYCVHHDAVDPLDITSNFKYHGAYMLLVRLLDACGGAKDFSSMYIVIKNIPDTPLSPTLTPTIIPTATPTPTPTPVQPFLDLPWDYQAKGQSFNDAALSITSFFDHTYPLLNIKPVIDETSEFEKQVTNFNNENSSALNYSSHDGYDFASLANVHIGDAVLAAAAGTATYINSCAACGNMISIDHHNGYQSRYLHLQKDGLITDIPDNPVDVSTHQKIGLVGATGNVIPSDERGAHIHFELIEDKNHDSIFNDIPDGYTDPFGWQASVVDPWSIFTFNNAGITRTGDKSRYLWKFDTDKTSNVITNKGGEVRNANFSLNFPEGAVEFDTKIDLKSGPVVSLPNKRSIGPKLIATATDSLGKAVTRFNKAFTIVMNFSTYDLTPFRLKSISLYSSQDGYIWEKQSTVIDMKTKTATAHIDHFTQFALIAELKDTSAPITEVKVTGKKSPDKSYRSDIKLKLKTKDHEDKIDQSYIMYKIDGDDWDQYKSPLNISSDGHHIIEFYSVDSAGNIEPTKKLEFNIQKNGPKSKSGDKNQDEQEEIVSELEIQPLITVTKGE